jgi:hypothetical protein
MLIMTGPGQSTEDVKWLDEQLKEFFSQAENRREDWSV